MDRGYIGVTDRAWFNNLRNQYEINEVNFWRKNTNNFKSLVEGDKFFFLVKNEKGNKKERKVLGVGTFVRYEIMTISEAWNKYKNGNGVASKEEFFNRMAKIYSDNLDDSQIGCIIIDEIIFFKNEVMLSVIDIEFQNSIVSGKGIGDEEVNRILNKNNLYNTAKEVSVFEENGYYDIVSEEGEKRLVTHFKIERDPKIIKLAKERFKHINGRLYCEVCGFDFEKIYGELGKNYIEGHHNKPLSDYQEGDVTKASDIRMLCSNCHRMIHKCTNIAVVDQLNEIIKKIRRKRMDNYNNYFNENT